MTSPGSYLESLFNTIGPLMLVAIGLSAVLSYFFRRTVGKAFGEAFVFVSPFAWLGAVAGFVAGSSQEPLIGALLTGILTIAGTLISYMVGKETDSEWRRPLPLAMMLLFLCALVGMTTGTANRVQWDDFDRDYDKWLKDYETITLPARAAAQRYNLCVKNASDDNKSECDKWLLRET